MPSGPSRTYVKYALAIFAAFIISVLVMRSPSRGVDSSGFNKIGSRGGFFGSSGDDDTAGEGGVNSLRRSLREVAGNVANMRRRLKHFHQHINKTKLGGASSSSSATGGEGNSKAVGFPNYARSQREPVVHHDDSIFVSVASYRDDECAPTVEDMYNRAKYPRSLFLGIVEQHIPDEGDSPCIPPSFKEQSCQLAKFCPTDQIQVRFIHPKDAKGPTFGRYVAMLMYRGEKYYMMIDSHNRFVTHWDNIIVTMYKNLPTKKGVLSHYPEAWHNPADKKETNAPLDNRPTTTYLCTAKFVDHLGYVRLDGFVVHKTKNPRPQPWAAAGFLFADSQMVKEIPFDPTLDFVFDGEEILYSVRMWTHGWDIFSPNENILYHYYYRTKAKKFWGRLPADWTTRRDAAQRRIQWYLKTYKKGTTERMVAEDTKEEWVTRDREKFGLGTERSLEDWYKFAGIDRTAYTVEKKFCQRA